MSRHSLPVLFSLLFFVFAGKSYSQSNFFNFNYPGPDTIELDAACSGTLAGNIGTPVVSSKIGANITQSVFDPLATGFSLGNIFYGVQSVTIVWHIEDDQNHTEDFSFEIHFADRTKPVFDLTGIPATLTFASVAQVPAPPDIPVSDNCTPASSVEIELLETTPPPLCDNGSFSRTWIATDASGNSTTFQQAIVIFKDQSPPTITGLPQNGSATCANLQTAYQNWLAAQVAAFTATDPSGIASLAHDAPANFPGGCPDAAPLNVVFTATDSCGFSATAMAQFSVSDQSAPAVLVEARDSIVACDFDGNPIEALSHWIHTRAGFVATDDCTPQPMLQYRMQVNGNDLDSAGVVAAFLASYANGCGTQQVGSQILNKVRGVIPVDFFAIDQCGKIGFLDRGWFAALDTLPPKISGANTNEQCGGANDTLALRAWIDAHGNASFSDDCSQITWLDFDWTSSDGQSGTGTYGNVATYPAPPAHSCNWHADVIFKLQDDCGNAAQDTIRWQILDSEAPVFVGVSPVDTIFCPDTIPQIPLVTVVDNCDTSLTLSFSFQLQNPDCPGNFSLLGRWTATDDCGNSATATKIFVFRDTLAPAFTLFPADDTTDCQSLPYPAPNIGAELLASDLCSNVDTIFYVETNDQNPNPNNCGHYNYLITRTFTARDECGNTSVRIQKIQVLDRTAPTFAGFADTTQACDNLAALPEPIASGECGQPVSPAFLESQVVTAGICPDSYTFTLRWASTDTCGNTGIFIQTVQVRDTVSPVLAGVPANATVGCQAIPTPPAIGTDLFATDNCDETPHVTLLEVLDRDPNPANCQHWANYGIRRIWTAEDNCGNTAQATQFISVQDDSDPVIEVPNDLTFPSQLDQCGANVFIPVPLGLSDACTSLQTPASIADTAAIVTTSGQPAPDVAADSIVLELDAPNLLPQMPAVGTATLTILLENADAEAAGEFFKIFNENGQQIGQTAPTNGQCGNSQATFTLPASLVNQWFADGTTTLTLAPNGTGADAPNAICFGGGKAIARLDYDYAAPQMPLTTAFALDGGARQAWPPTGGFLLEIGQHTVEYFATDCAGNEGVASLQISIVDVQPPFVGQPAGLTTFVGQADCSGSATLPFPVLSDNCGFAENFDKSSDLASLRFFDHPNADTVPQDVVLEIGNAVPNATATGRLLIRHRGKNALPGQFFNVFDENDNFLSVTTLGNVGDACTAVFHESSIPVSASQINTWAADGSVRFKLVSNKDVVNFQEFVSPCGPLAPDGSDGLSAVQARLEYTFANVHFDIKNAGGAVVQSGTLTGNTTPVTLPGGNYTVRYLLNDANGLPGEANFALSVRDTVAPTTACLSTTIFTNPAGTVDYTLTASEINGGCADNCTPAGDLVLSLSKTNFTCNDAGGFQNIVLTATDASGNSASCSALVKIETASFSPGFQDDVCENNPVQLFANAPAAPGGVVFTYAWSGPGGFLSNEANPTIPMVNAANEGNYFVTITGITGCQSTASVAVTVQHLPVTPDLSADDANLCDGENLLLHTTPYVGTNVLYSWFAGTPGNETMLGETAFPDFLVPAPPVGPHDYFVKISADACNSLPSAVLDVTVFARPTATVMESAISVCEGQSLALGTSVQGTGVTYQWSGPNAFSATQQFPAVLSASTQAAGQYTLIVFENGCPSAPAHTQVEVRPKPATPTIANPGPHCVGETVELVCNTLNAGEYVWLSPDFDTLSTQTNALNLPAIALADSGAWQVYVMQLGCRSDFSAPQIVAVQDNPQVAAAANTPLCVDSILHLEASASLPGLTYAWSGPNNFASFQQNPLANAVTGMYTVIASTSIGCADTASINVEVSTPPVIVQVKYSTAWVNGVQGCVSGTNDLTLDAVLTQNNPSFQYHWTGPNGFESFDKNPVLPNANAALNGTYTLSVKNQNGCESLKKSVTIDLRDRPATPILSADSPICEGELLVVKVTNANQYTGNALIFNWTAPTGAPQTPTGTLQIPNASTANHSGNFAVAVAVDGCPSLASAPVNVQVNPKPAAPAITGNSPICAGDTLQMEVAPVPGGQFVWSGPGGFSAGVSNPILPGISDLFAGNYQVTVRLNGCTSLPSEPYEVEVKPVPQTPFVENDGAVCLDQAGDKLVLSVTSNSWEPGALYTWYNAGPGNQIGPPTTAKDYQLANFQGITEGQFGFYAIATLAGCRSPQSNVTLVTFNEIPANAAFAGNDFEVCDQLPLALSGTQPSIGTGLWTQVAGPAATIANPDAANTSIAGTSAGNFYRFAWTLTNGACLDYSSDTVWVQINAFEQAQSLPTVDTCFAESVVIQAIPGQTTPGSWSQPTGQALLGIEIESPNEPNTAVKNLEPGNTYYFHWTLADAGCGPSTAITTVRVIGSSAYAGEDLRLCSNENDVLLQAGPLPQFESGLWSSNDPDIAFNAPGNPTTSATGLKTGDNMFVWTTNDGICGLRSHDTLIVHLEMTPVAKHDTVVVPFGHRTGFKVLTNDLLPDLYELEITSDPQFGSIEQTGPDAFTYFPELSYSGEDKITYKVCNLNCDSSCGFATVIFQVQLPDACDIPTLITPNEDLVNDVFYVPCLGGDLYPDNSVSIFNQWGDEVFHASPYQNNWKGEHNGQPLPAGTYFFVVKLNGSDGIKSGFLMIQR